MSENQSIDDTNSNNYFNDDSLVEDDYYFRIKEIIKCNACSKIILKDPKMCDECNQSFCKNCSEEKSNNENHKCENPTYKDNKILNSMLDGLTYLCNNCKREIKKKDIINHLKEKCEKVENTDKLFDALYRKKDLIRLSPEEIKRLPQNKNINHISGKIIFINIIHFSDIIR